MQNKWGERNWEPEKGIELGDVTVEALAFSSVALLQIIAHFRRHAHRKVTAAKVKVSTSEYLISSRP